METPVLVPAVDPMELEQMIRQRAFEIYLERAEAHEEGTPDHDWQIAMQEIAAHVDVRPN